MTDQRTCRRCHHTKPLIEFAVMVNNDGRAQYRQVCMLCWAAQARENGRKDRRQLILGVIAEPRFAEDVADELCRAAVRERFRVVREKLATA